MLDMKYLLDLNPEQREAVTSTEGPLLVLAGAGTGKTRVITCRIAYIIDQFKASPNEIIAVTFTNKAASEMHQRVEEMTNAKGAYIGTFHSIAAKILRANAELVDLTSSFSIIDQSEQTRVIKNICETHSISIGSHSPKDITETIARWKDQGEQTNINYNIQINEISRRVYCYYQQQLITSNVVDFGDLLSYNIKIFQTHPEILKLYQQKFKYIFIDEYQDTNNIQYSWAKMLAKLHSNLCCVGDDDQSIYSWRGAKVENILKFKDDFNNAKIIKLERNYRSTNPILITASSIIQHNKNRYSKKLWTDQPSKEPVKIVYCYNDLEEARFITSVIKKIIAYNQQATIAVLVRSSFQTHVLEEAFFSNSIRYRVIGGFRFYERMEIIDMMAYIRVVINHNDSLALERIINIPKRSIGTSTLQIIKEYSQQHNISIFTAIENMLSKNLFKNKLTLIFQDLIQKFKNWQSLYKSSCTPAQLTQVIFQESKYLQALQNDKSDQAIGRIENIQEMIRSMTDYNNINEFLEHASLFLERDNNDNSANVINLMTLHAAKGLEFDVVFLPGWEDGVFPHQKSLADQDKSSLEEERRVAYVGITRAKKSLYISYANKRRIFNEFIELQPSRFLNDIPIDVSLSTTSISYFAEKKLPIQLNNFKNLAKQNNNLNHKRTLYPGVKVNHEKFGQGTIIRICSENIEVAFYHYGVKTIKRQFLNFEK